MSVIRIAVGFKVTPDYEALREADWVAGEADGVQTRFVPRVLNCFDESALELALRLSAALHDHDATVHLGALSVGGRESKPFLETLLALGYGRAARVDPEMSLDFAPAVVAAIIAAWVRRVDRSDLLLLGCRSGPGDSGTVPFRIAEALGWPCLTQVVELEAQTADSVRVACTTDDGLLRLTLQPPCVLAVGNAVVSHLRVPTLSDRLARRDARVDVLAAADLGIDVGGELEGRASRLVGLEAIRRTRPSVIVGGATAREKARTLFAAHLKTVIGRL